MLVVTDVGRGTAFDVDEEIGSGIEANLWQLGIVAVGDGDLAVRDQPADEFLLRIATGSSIEVARIRL